MKPDVVTWQSPSGATIRVCAVCAARLTMARSWPKDATKQEFCSVSYGMHRDRCDICEKESEETESELVELRDELDEVRGDTTNDD